MTGTATSPTETLTGETGCDADLQTRLLRIVEGGPEAIQERLDELDCTSTNSVPTLASSMKESGGLILQKLFGPNSRVASALHLTRNLSVADVERERIALRALRGDFQHLPTIHAIEDRQAVSRMEDEGGIVHEPEDMKPDNAEAVEAIIQATAK